MFSIGVVALSANRGLPSRSRSRDRRAAVRVRRARLGAADLGAAGVPQSACCTNLVAQIIDENVTSFNDVRQMKSIKKGRRARRGKRKKILNTFSVN